MTNINKFLYQKLSSLSSGIETNEFRLLVSRAAYLSSIGIDSDAKLKMLTLIKSAARDLDVRLSKDEILKVLAHCPKSRNDILYAISKAKIDSVGIRKIAYPNPGLSVDSIAEEFDINKWLNIVYKIYSSIESGDMSRGNAIEYYSNTLDDKERESFLNWFKYYSSGEHTKYSEKEEHNMKKEAVYSGSLGQAGDTYSAGSGSFYSNKNTGNNMPGDSFAGSTFDEASSLPAKSLEEKNSFNTWKQQLYGAIRRVDKLIRSDAYVEHEDYKDLSEALSNLSILAKKIKLARTLSDVTYKTASAFEKAGSKEAASILMKVAQAVPPEEEPVEAAGPVTADQAVLTPQAPEAAMTAAPDPAQEPEGHGLSSQEEASGTSVPESDDVEPISLRNITPIPGAAPGEYEALAGNITLIDASNKLDEVAGLLADRRIIRQLAEFDIMLDKIGVASMFPELAESQSKLIDAFSYALTRVTKMMGQLANASVIANSRSGIPGAEDVATQDAEQQEGELSQEGDLNAGLDTDQGTGPIMEQSEI